MGLATNTARGVPPNVKFEIDDVESPWLHSVPFDYIFCRYMAACIQDWPKLVGNIFEFVPTTTPQPREAALWTNKDIPETSPPAAGPSSRTSTCSTTRRTAR